MKRKIITVFLDLKRTFEAVNRAVSTLKSIRNWRLLELNSYLTEQYQWAELKNCKSETVCITDSVPEGKVLGTLLFLAYMHDNYVRFDNF